MIQTTVILLTFSLANFGIAKNITPSKKFSGIQCAVEFSRAHPDSLVDYNWAKDITIHHSNDDLKIICPTEQFPQYPGGNDALIDYFAKHLQYPPEASIGRIEGKVFIQCVIEKDGKVKDVKVYKGIGGICDEAAIRVIESMPAWIPGEQNGHPVEVEVFIPIVFKLDDIQE